MPCLNRVFEEMDVKYGNRKVPSKILKSVEEKASRATMAKNTIAHVESKKRKTVDVPKVLTKRRKAARISKVASTGSTKE